MKIEQLRIDPKATVKSGWDWDYANSLHETIIQQAMSLPCHVIFTGEDKAEYTGNYQPSGDFVPRWQKQVPFRVDIVMQLKKIRNVESGMFEFYGEITDSRHMDPTLHSLMGTVMKNPTFQKILDLIEGKDAPKE
jgi:hypothetical protein